MSRLWSAYCAKCSTREQIRAPDREAAHTAYTLLGWGYHGALLLCPPCGKKYDEEPTEEKPRSEASRR